MRTSAQVDDLISMHEVSQILGLTYHGVYALVTKGHLEPTAYVLGRRVFRRTEIEALAAERRRNPPNRGGYREGAGRKPKGETIANKKAT